MTPQYTFRKPGIITLILKSLFVVGLLVSLLKVGSSFLQLQLLSSPGELDKSQAEMNDLREGCIALIGAGVYLTTVVFFCIWIVRAHKNVRALGATDMEFTPGWAVGWFFIPFANLVKPFQAMKELWRASHNPLAWENAAASSIVPLWWALWILGNITAQISMRLSFNADDRPKLIASTYVEIADAALEIPLAIVALVMVSAITAAQTRAAEQSDALIVAQPIIE